MTPNELLTSVKTRFVTLFHSDANALTNLLRQALNVYQDKAGVINEVIIPEGQLTLSIPEHFDGLIACGNKNGARVRVAVNDDELNFSAASRRDYPLTLSYFVNLKGVDLDTYQLPSESVRFIADYLELLIQIPNSAREARVAAAGEMDLSHIPTEADIRARMKDLESEMECQLVLPTVSVR